MAKKYRMKPIVVEVAQWNGENHKEMAEFGVIGELNVPVGTYIVKSKNNSFHAMTPEAFHATYERHLVWDENI